MTSKTNNEEYHCDREEPSAEPINLNNEELCQFDVSVYKFDEHVNAYDLRDELNLFYEHVMAQQYFEREMLRGEMGCVPDYLNCTVPFVSYTILHADGHGAGG